LDHILVSKSLAANFTYLGSKSHSHCEANQCEIVPLKDLGVSYEQVSDHCPVVSEIQY
jgi:exonuclease III